MCVCVWGGGGGHGPHPPLQTSVSLGGSRPSCLPPPPPYRIPGCATGCPHALDVIKWRSVWTLSALLRLSKWRRIGQWNLQLTQILAALRHIYCPGASRFNCNCRSQTIWFPVIWLPRHDLLYLGGRIWGSNNHFLLFQCPLNLESKYHV